MSPTEHLPEHHCDYCGGAFNGRHYHEVDGYDTVCAHCCVELLLTQRQQLQEAVEDAERLRTLLRRCYPIIEEIERKLGLPPFTTGEGASQSRGTP